ncbi:MAG: hypothetical protein ACI84E_001457, partial [Planctomycetota bacterium]
TGAEARAAGAPDEDEPPPQEPSVQRAASEAEAKTFFMDVGGGSVGGPQAGTIDLGFGDP